MRILRSAELQVTSDKSRAPAVLVGLLMVFLCSFSGVAAARHTFRHGGNGLRHGGSGLQPYFVGDPNASHSLRPWQYFEDGPTFSVAASPQGASRPGVVKVVGDPLGQEGMVYQETVCSTCNNSSGAQDGDWTYLFNTQSRLSYYGQNNQTDWLHFRVMFPGGGRYRNTRGEWNWLYEAHDDNNLYNFPMTCEDEELGLTVVQYDGDPYPYLALRILGGRDTCPLANGTWIYDWRHRLRYNHWYDMLFHVVWSPKPRTGFVQWWRDGRRMVSRHIADLWQRPDGSTDHVAFELNNYRLHANWSSTIYYGETMIGPTRSSVRF
jgi:hypothetical protein